MRMGVYDNTCVHMCEYNYVCNHACVCACMSTSVCVCPCGYRIAHMLVVPLNKAYSALMFLFGHTHMLLMPISMIRSEHVCHYHTHVGEAIEQQQKANALLIVCVVTHMQATPS